MKISCVALSFTVSMLARCCLGVVYVNSANWNIPDMDGKTAATGYGTIQEGVNAAPSGGTVLVAPGVYDKGGKTFDWTHDGVTVACSNRVLIDKPLTLKAISSNPADTVIKGAWDPNPTGGNKYGIGPAAVRCVRAQAADVIVKGFTLADGSCQALTAETTDGDAGRVGGFAGYSGSYITRNFAVDCVITNCAGSRGAALRHTVCVRCEIVDCWSEGGQAGARHVWAFHSLFRRNDSRTACIGESHLVNSAVVQSLGANGCTSSKVNFYNSLVYANQTAPASIGSDCHAYNSAFQALGNVAAQTDCVSGEIYAFVAPLLGDWRLRKGAQSETLGSVARLNEAIEALGVTVPDEVEIRKSLDGVTIDSASTAPIAAGPYQKAIETYGGLSFRVGNGTMSFKAEGAAYGLSSASYAFATTYPAILTVTIDGANPVHRVDRSSAYGGNWYPDMSNRLVCGFPPAGIVVTNSVYAANKIVYVNPDGVDDDADGRGASAELPFRTLQYAVDHAGNRGVVVAAAGRYAEGGDQYASVSNRVTVKSGNHIRILGAGAGKSFIVGQGDESDPAGDGWKRGPAAMRCVGIFGGEAAVQGFTLTGGRSGYVKGDNSEISANLGGCVNAYYNSRDQHILDCEITDGIAFRGGLARGGYYVRCTFTGGRSIGGGLIRDSVYLNACLVHGNLDGATLDSASVATYQSTLVRHSEDNVIAGWQGLPFANSIVVGSGNITSLGTTYGSLLDGFGTITAKSGATIEYVTGAPVFVDAANGDYRIGSSSPAVNCGRLLDDWWQRPACDLNGRPLRFVGGKPVAGAFADPVAVVNASVLGDVSVSPSGTQFVEAGETVTFTATEGTRPFKGFTVDGEPVEGSATTYSFTAPLDSSLTSAVAIAAVPITDFYVNADPEIGDDTNNDGFTPETPKFTLAGAMAISDLGTVPGDTVHAAAGTYGSGDMESFAGTIRSRVTVPPGVTLVADDGPEATAIVGGAPASPDANGLGDGAIRCASVKATGVLRGFTLTGGRVASGTTDSPDYCGGGVLMEPASGDTSDESKYPRVENCVITNCVAGRGGAGSGTFGVYVNCRIVGNKATTTSSALYRGIAYGCYFDGNVHNQMFRYANALYGCTITAGNKNLDGTECGSIFVDFAGARPYTGFKSTLEGCVLLCKGMNSAYITNSIVVAGRIGANTSTEFNTVLDGIAAAKLDENGVPQKDSPAVDAIVAADVPAILGGRDAALGQRIYNGKADLGAFEYDWRSDYASYLGGAKASVPKASANLVEAADASSLVLGEGVFGLKLAGGTTDAPTKYALPLEVLGAGTLTVVVNGAQTNLYTAADGAATLAFKNDLAENSLTFAYDADDEGVSFGAFARRTSGFRLLLR